MGHAACLRCPFDNCDKVFTCYMTLRMHQKGPAHAGEGGVPLCKTCGATFATVAEYSVHVQGHSMEHLAKARKQKKDVHGVPVVPPVPSAPSVPSSLLGPIYS